MKSGGDNRLLSEINVTPFVDVMLVLLIIFMVTAPMMVQGVQVQLPEATTAPLESNQDQLVVSITDKQEIFINDFKIGLDGLQEKLGHILSGRGSRVVYLKADRQVPYGIVARVMAEVKATGVEKLGLITLPIEASNSKKNQNSGRQ